MRERERAKNTSHLNDKRETDKEKYCHTDKSLPSNKQKKYHKNKGNTNTKQEEKCTLSKNI
jgi:hypothetical protein